MNKSFTTWHILTRNTDLFSQFFLVELIKVLIEYGEYVRVIIIAFVSFPRVPVEST